MALGDNMANTKTYYDTLNTAASAADEDIIVIQTTGTSDLSTMKKTTVGVLRKKTVDMIASNAHASSNAGSYVFGIEQNTEGRVDANLKGFETYIIEGDDLNNTSSISDDNAPTSQAVYDFVEKVRASEILQDIQYALGTLDVSQIGNTGTLVQSVSETDGKISAETINLDDSISSAASGVPTSKAVLDKIESLDVASAGGNGKYIKQISEVDGKIIPVEETLVTTLDTSNKAATSNAVKTYVDNNISSLTGAVGNTGVLLQSVTETNGKITGVSITLDHTISVGNTGVPTTEAVYDGIQGSIETALDALEYTAGTAGFYFNTIKQTDGQVETTSKKFDTYEGSTGTTAGAWKNGSSDITPDNNNVPSTEAVQKYADYKHAVINKRVDDTNLASVGADGYFIQKVSQSSGAVSAFTKAFENGTIASYADSASASSYSSDATTAPTVRAVAEQVKRLDQREDDTNTRITNITTGPFGASGAFVSKIQQDGGFISASTTNFVSSIASSTTEANNVAPTEHAVRQAINALDVEQIGAKGKYIRFVVQADGKISATPIEFDDFASGAVADSWANKTNENAPSTIAVYRFVSRVKEDILEKTKSMTYEGTVGTLSDLQGKKPYDKGDTFIASGSFNLKAENPDIAHKVNKGDMLICKADNIEYDEDNFDIIGGSEYQIVFDGTARAASAGCIPVFADNSGTVLQNSGETINTIIAYSGSAGAFASLAGSYASDASHAASFASTGIQPYISSAASEASTAACHAACAASSATVAACNASLAQNSSTAAATAMSGARNSSTAAATALSGTRDSSNAAVTAKSGAQNSSTAAATAMSGARGSSNAAATAMSGAQNSSTAAATAMSGAQNSSTAAATAMSGAQNSSTAAATAMSGAQNSSTAASGYACSASNFSVAASGSASTAASYAASANLQGILNDCTAARASAQAASSGAVASASAASQSAACAASIAANAVKKTGETSQSIDGNITMTGTIQANTFKSASSRKMKENITPTIISALDVIDKVDIVDFNYITDDEKTPHIGFIAEDTDSLLSTPHLNGMDHANCIGVLLKAVQEITQGMASLAKKVEQ